MKTGSKQIFAWMGNGLKTMKLCDCTFWAALHPLPSFWAWGSGLFEMIWYVQSGPCLTPLGLPDLGSFAENQGISKATLRSELRSSQRGISHLVRWKCFGLSVPRLFPEFRAFAKPHCHAFSSCCLSIKFWNLVNVSGLRYITFWRRYKTTWQNTLRFLPASSHGTCDVCLDFKRRFRTAVEPCHFAV